MYDNIKLAFFDIDRTLLSHEYPKAGKKQLTYYEECCEALTSLAQVHEGDKPIKAMQWLVKILQNNGVKCCAITHEIFNLRDEYKKNAVKRYYDITEYLTVNKAKHKIDMIAAVADTQDIALQDCLLVDDRMDIIRQACEVGIQGVHTSNIQQMFEDLFAKQLGCEAGCEYPVCLIENGHCPYVEGEGEPIAPAPEGFMNLPT